MRTVFLVAGESGSGKSRLAAVSDCAHLGLDDFYYDGDHPDLPHTLGIVDWDDVASWDLQAAVAAVADLLRTGRADVPRYSISTNAQIGHHRLELGQATCFVAEGVFAPDLLAPLRERGLAVEPIWLDRPRTLTALRRLRRDLAERRKPPGILIRRGLALWRAEPTARSRALALGFRPLGMPAAQRAIRRHQR